MLSYHRSGTTFELHSVLSELIYVLVEAYQAMFFDVGMMYISRGVKDKPLQLPEVSRNWCQSKWARCVFQMNTPHLAVFTRR